MFQHLFKFRLTSLRRWGHMNDKKKETIKFILANRDNCGDILCGNPRETKEIINKELKKNLNKNDF